MNLVLILGDEQIEVDEELSALVVEAADNAGLSIQEWVLDALNEAVENY